MILSTRFEVIHSLLELSLSCVCTNLVSSLLNTSINFAPSSFASFGSNLQCTNCTLIGCYWHTTAQFCNEHAVLGTYHKVTPAASNGTKHAEKPAVSFLHNTKNCQHDNKELICGVLRTIECRVESHLEFAVPLFSMWLLCSDCAKIELILYRCPAQNERQGSLAISTPLEDHKNSSYVMSPWWCVV